MEARFLSDDLGLELKRDPEAPDEQREDLDNDPSPDENAPTRS